MTRLVPGVPEGCDQTPQDQGAEDGTDRAVVFGQRCKSAAEGGRKGPLFFRHRVSPHFRKDFVNIEQEGTV